MRANGASFTTGAKRTRAPKRNFDAALKPTGGAHHYRHALARGERRRRTDTMSTIAIHHGPRSHRFGFGLPLAVVLLTMGGCYEGMEPERVGDADEVSDLDVEPLDGPVLPVTCGPQMTVFPVAAAHNIGYDHASCGTGTCAISCPDANANSDWSAHDHQGIDVFAFQRAPMVAVASGTIRKVGVVSNTSGLRVRLRDDCGWEYYYGHLDEAVVSEGQRVDAGQLIGFMGKTGTGSTHLHFNVSPDGGYSNDINPFDLLKATSPTACGAAVPPAPEPPAPEPPATDGGQPCAVLAPDQALWVNEAITSCNGRFTLVMQDDGNVVLYENGGGAVWHSQTHGTAGRVVVMQTDGNFVLYDGAGAPLWHTGTHGHPGAMMRVEDDGNVVVWNGWTALWKAR
jgi:hypothetical protein